MKIRCGSHQQNRSIVRPGLSLMAAKVALTAEEFRENSQRSIALFNTEKLSTNSTHVLKSAYCNSVHFCRCNLHGACGGKVPETRIWKNASMLQSARSVWRQRPSPRSCTSAATLQSARSVWRQRPSPRSCTSAATLQSARSVWRQRALTNVKPYLPLRCNLHGACGGKDCVKPVSDTLYRCNLHGACGGKGALQFHPYY